MYKPIPINYGGLLRCCIENVQHNCLYTTEGSLYRCPSCGSYMKIIKGSWTWVQWKERGLVDKNKEQAISKSVCSIRPARKLNIFICSKCGHIVVTTMTHQRCIKCAPEMNPAICGQCKWYGLATRCLSWTFNQIACPLEKVDPIYGFRPLRKIIK